MGCASSTETVPNTSSKESTKSNDADKLQQQQKKIHRESTEGTNSSLDVSSASANGGSGDSSGGGHGTGASSSSSLLETIDSSTRIISDDKKTISTKTTKSVFGNFTIRYACVSRHGRDPDALNKPNQDSYSVHHNICNVKEDAFFAVYDGHGPTGDLCSQFAAKRLPALLEKHYKANLNIKTQSNQEYTTEQIQGICHNAHVECNNELRDDKSIDDSFSGTTAISVYVHGNTNRITICNVGDSRAIIGSRANNSSNTLRAVPLSKDQTPHRSDEAQRCIQNGARILSFGQLGHTDDDDDDDDDSIEDPPRVWSQTGKYPGTAFTRSIGDSIAETLGVYGVPEMITIEVNLTDKILFLASDGIFDVMSNQDVIDMCTNFDNPYDACMAIIEKSHEEWLKNEDCINEESASYDDMTIICLYIDDVWEMFLDDDVADVKSSKVINNTTTASGTSITATAATTTSAIAISNNSTTDEAAAAAETTDNDQQQSQQPHHHRKRVRQKTLKNLLADE